VKEFCSTNGRSASSISAVFPTSQCAASSARSFVATGGMVPSSQQLWKNGVILGDRGFADRIAADWNGAVV